jgi:hypothetical protein
MPAVMGQLFADLIPAMNLALEPADREVALVAMRQLAPIDFDKLPTHNYSVQGQKGGPVGGLDPKSGRVTPAKVSVTFIWSLKVSDSRLIARPAQDGFFVRKVHRLLDNSYVNTTLFVIDDTVLYTWQDKQILTDQLLSDDNHTLALETLMYIGEVTEENDPRILERSQLVRTILDNPAAYEVASTHRAMVVKESSAKWCGGNVYHSLACLGSAHSLESPYFHYYKLLRGSAHIWR